MVNIHFNNRFIFPKNSEKTFLLVFTMYWGIFDFLTWWQPWFYTYLTFILVPCIDYRLLFASMSKWSRYWVRLLRYGQKGRMRCWKSRTSQKMCQGLRFLSSVFARNIGYQSASPWVFGSDGKLETVNGEAWNAVPILLSQCLINFKLTFHHIFRASYSLHVSSFCILCFKLPFYNTFRISSLLPFSFWSEGENLKHTVISDSTWKIFTMFQVFLLRLSFRFNALRGFHSPWISSFLFVYPHSGLSECLCIAKDVYAVG